jgi:hypothetical protein
MSALVYTTTCQLCHQKFQAPSIKSLLNGNGTQIIGTQPVEQVKRIMEKLSLHIQKNHPNEYAQSVGAGLQLAGVLRMFHYATEDAYAVTMREHMRWTLLKLLQRNHVPDEKIREKVREAGFQDLIQPRIVALLCEMRDILEERGQFAAPEPNHLDAPAPVPVSG